MHVFGGHQLAAHRRLAAGEDRNIAAPGKFADLPRVARGVVQRHVAGDGDDAEHVQLPRRRERHQDRGHIVLAGVGVEDDLASSGLAGT